MDWVTVTNTALSTVKKYRYVLLVVLIGILLLTFPGQQEESEPVTLQNQEVSSQAALEDALAQILSLVEGAGRVEVLLTQSRGEEILYQTDGTLSSGEHSTDKRTSTVLITGESRQETGLVKQRNPPVYQGAIVLCQGAGSPGVRLSIVEAVMRVTGLSSDKITVLKMK